MTCLSVAVFAALSASGDPAILAPIGPAGPFADLHHQVAPALMKAACWLAAAGGGAGVVTGLAAVRRGWRPHPGLLLAACSAVTLVLGHNPWVMTPEQLFRRHDPVGVLAPPECRGQPTVYGPAATAVEVVAARHGGTSMAWIAFWIKVVNGICFVAVAALLDRLAGPDQARRARASWRASRSPSRSPSPAPSRGLAVGLRYVVTGRHRTAVLAAGIAGGAIVLAAGYAVAGPAAWKSLSQRLSSAQDSFLPLPGAVYLHPAAYAGVTLAAFAVVGSILAWRLPPGHPDLPEIRPMLVCALALLPGIGITTAQYREVRVVVPVFTVCFLTVAALGKLRARGTE